MDANWNYSLNNTVNDTTTLAAQSQFVLFQLKVKLLAARWTVVSSSNGSTFSAADNWATYSGLVVGSTTSTARSWILLASPVGHVAGANGTYLGTQSQSWLIIDYQSSNAYSARFIFSSALPTGGSTTAVPTTSNASKQNIVSSQFSYASVGNAIKYNFMYTPSNGGFIFLVTSPGTNQLTGIVYSIPLVNTSSNGGVPYPYAVVQGAYGNNVSSSSTVNIFSNSMTYSVDGLYLATSIQTIIPSSNNRNINNYVEAYPVYVLYTSGSLSGELGQIPDIYNISYNAYPGGTTAPNNTINYSIIYSTMFPANSSILS